MADRLPWGHKSRHCLRCGKVGPRMIVSGGHIHKYCMTTRELSALRRATTQSGKAAKGEGT